MAVKIMKCDCDHAYQDKKYGKGKRVHNPMGIMKEGQQATAGRKYRCTVCASEKTV